MSYTSGSLLLVIPPVVRYVLGELRVDGDFANNLAAYLRHFDKVTVMCPASSSEFTFPNVVSVRDIERSERLEFVVLPFPYREDRYVMFKPRVKSLLRRQLRKAQYVLLSPHAGLDWSTLAAHICIEEDIPYNMEADWNLPAVRRYMLAEMKAGPRKLRAYLFGRYHDRQYFHILRHSRLALLQGGDVYHDFASIAPNAFPVLNIQITQADRISDSVLTRKTEAVQAGYTPLIVYAGRASDIKGPLLWLDVITRLRDAGHRFHATWAGDGERLDEMKKMVKERNLGAICTLAGKLDRSAARALVQSSHIFMFCHMAKESPRCLVEALGSGTPIVGFGSAYSRELVAQHGGGNFVPVGDVEALGQVVTQLISDPDSLRDLIARAARSGGDLDRERAIEERIRLMKTYLSCSEQTGLSQLRFPTA